MAGFNKPLTGKIQRLDIMKCMNSTIKSTDLSVSFHISEAMPEKISKVHKLLARYAHQNNIDFISFKVARLKGGNPVFSTRDEYIATRQYYRNLKRPTRCPRDQVNIDIKNFIDITSMPTHHLSIPPRQRITSSRASRVSMDSDSDDDVMSYPTIIRSSVGMSRYGRDYSDVVEDSNFFLHW